MKTGIMIRVETENKDLSDLTSEELFVVLETWDRKAISRLVFRLLHLLDET